MKESVREALTIERFDASAIDPACFDHEAHVYVGWLYIMTYPHDDAIARFDAALRLDSSFRPVRRLARIQTA